MRRHRLRVRRRRRRRPRGLRAPPLGTGSVAGERGLTVNLRKPLLFTAVFGVGLTTLWFTRDEPSERPERPAPRSSLALLAQGEGEKEAGALFGGRLEYTQFASEEREGRRPKLLAKALNLSN